MRFLQTDSWGFLVIGGVFVLMGIMILFAKKPKEFIGKVTAVDKAANKVTVKIGRDKFHEFECLPGSPVPNKGTKVVMTGTPDAPESVRFNSKGMTFSMLGASAVFILFGAAFIAGFFFVK